MHVTTSQYETIGKNQIKFAQSKRVSPEHNLPIAEKIHWNKQHFGMM